MSRRRSGAVGITEYRAPSPMVAPISRPVGTEGTYRMAQFTTRGQSVPGRWYRALTTASRVVDGPVSGDGFLGAGASPTSAHDQICHTRTDQYETAIYLKAE